MALGGNVLRQHVVEFIRGTGVVTDGVVDSTSLNGPWSWQVPDGVADLTLDGCGAGGGGGGGTATGTALNGGGGGGCGLQVLGVRLSVAPLASLTVSVGAGGPGGAATDSFFVAGTSGGNSTISGILVSPFASISTVGSTSNVQLLGGGGGESPGSSTSGGQPAAVYRNGTNATAAARGNAAGQAGGTNSSFDVRPLGSGSVITSGAGGGGVASATPASAGGNGAHGGDGLWLAQIGENWGNATRRGNGNTTGTVSRGGGGNGAPSLFATFPKGGDGGQAGGTATGFGAGGGGGGGGAAGGNGLDGYIRFTYWSMD